MRFFKRAWSFCKSFLIIVLGFVIACFLLEILVLAIWGEQPKFPRHVVEAPWGIRYNEPNASYRHKSSDLSVTFNINEQGMRANKNFSYEKPKDTKRILFLGDSFTIGYEVELEDSFPSLIERNLQNEGYKVEVLNAGVSGFSNAEEYLYLEKELIKYEPDIVVLSFYPNDLLDNVRTKLFNLQDNKLIQTNEKYVPGGTVGNFLNTNWFFNALSEYSNAFAFIKHRVTKWLKSELNTKAEEIVFNEPQGQHAIKSTPQKMEKGRVSDVDTELPENSNLKENHTDMQESSSSNNTGGYTEQNQMFSNYEKKQELAAAIIDRMYLYLRERNIPLIIQEIPVMIKRRKGNDFQITLIDRFPLEFFDIHRPGVYFYSARESLEPFLGTELLYWENSHFHWTPFSHQVAAKDITQIIIDDKLLDRNKS